nr:MAG TPA: hypothetical protein [Caudoviricetes sp.]
MEYIKGILFTISKVHPISSTERYAILFGRYWFRLYIIDYRIDISTTIIYSYKCYNIITPFYNTNPSILVYLISSYSH